MEEGVGQPDDELHHLQPLHDLIPNVFFNHQQEGDGQVMVALVVVQGGLGHQHPVDEPGELVLQEGSQYQAEISSYLCLYPAPRNSDNYTNTIGSAGRCKSTTCC